ncbi:MAG: hypothetical protein WCA08_23135 [Desulfoferrobacter sp.]
MNELDRHLLKRYAAKYIWWKQPDDALKTPERVVAQVMDIGDYDDVQALANAVGDEYLRHVIEHAEPGMFSCKSWAYWHYRLALCRPGQVPEMPQRKVA